MSERHLVIHKPRSVTEKEARRLKKIYHEWVEAYAPTHSWVECCLDYEGRPLRFYARETR